MLSVSDFFSFLHWWGILFIIGIAFLPITTRLFGTFYDKGYAFSKIIGLVIISYIALTFGTMHVLPFTTVNCFLIVLWCILIQGIVFLKYSFTSFLKRVITYGKRLWFVLILEECLFFFGLYAWSVVRTFAPDVHGLEKYMDFGFVNSILRSTYFPPKDMWYTPLPINYYYFGHFMTAILARLTLIPANIAFNFMIATLFAFAVSLTFSIGSNLFYHFITETKAKLSFFRVYKGVILCGLLCAFFVALAGNLHTLYSFFRSYNTDNPQPPTAMLFSPQTFPNGYWYPDATRFIYHTIHEFPSYSFVVSDLHGHVLDIPVVLTAIALLFAIYKQIPFSTSAAKNKKMIFYIFSRSYPYFSWIFLSFLLGIMYMTNAWDGMIYFLLALPVAFVHARKKRFFSIRDIINTEFLQTILLLLAGLLIFSLPFSLFFQPGALVGGIGVICSPLFLQAKGKIGPFLFEPNHCAHSPLWQLGILYGFFFFWLLALGLSIWHSWKSQKKLFPTDSFLLILAGIALFLIAIPEFFYLKDIYATYFRANTMFKLVYQAFILLSLVSGYGISRFFSLNIRQLKLRGQLSFCILAGFGLCLLALVSIYPYFAIPSYYNDLHNPRTLDGTAYLATLYPSDYQAIQWINVHISGQPVIAEAEGDSYTDYARISANTGLPTIIGWPVHEWLWRGTYNIVPPRSTDVQTLYETGDPVIAKSIIAKYNVEFVFVGQLERQKYKVEETKFNQIGHVVYNKDLTTIYQVFP